MLEFERALVIGCSGAGKSTFARKLREKTGLPVYHLDMLWHKPDKTTVSKDEFDEALKKLLSEEKWIIDGNFSRTLELRMEACDIVFLLDFPVEECIAGVESRIGKKREDMPWIETEFDEEFRQWILKFPQKELPEVYRILDKYRDSKTIVVFHSRKEIEYYLAAEC